MDLPLILAITIIGHTLIGFLIDDRNSCNIINTDTREQLWLQQSYLNPYHDGYLLAFNESVSRPYRMIALPLSLGERVHERHVTFKFFVILCKSAFKGIIGISFLAKLDAVASLVHLRLAYHNMEWKSTVVNVYLEEAMKIKGIVFKDILASSA